MIWQRVTMPSCVPSFYRVNDIFSEAKCQLRIDFKNPFKEFTYFANIIGQDRASGAIVQVDSEGSEFSFGIQQQDRNGLNILISRVAGSNDLNNETMGFTIFGIGK